MHSMQIVFRKFYSFRDIKERHQTRQILGDVYK
jgi:hypothetical protein